MVNIFLNIVMHIFNYRADVLHHSRVFIIIYNNLGCRIYVCTILNNHSLFIIKSGLCSLRTLSIGKQKCFLMLNRGSKRYTN